jgi:hypothetical protein
MLNDGKSTQGANVVVTIIPVSIFLDLLECFPTIPIQKQHLKHLTALNHQWQTAFVPSQHLAQSTEVLN